jgi:hypothetical protein
MPNITSTQGTQIGALMTVAAQRGLDALKANLNVARRVRRDTDFESAIQGQALTIPIFGTSAAQDKAEGTPASATLPTGAGKVTVTLNKHKYVDRIIEDVVRTLSRPDLVDGYMQSMTVGIAEAIEADVLALAKTFTSGVGTYGTDVAKATLIAAAKAHTDAKIPQAGRYLALSSKDFYALFSDADLKEYLAFQRDAIETGVIRNLFGYEVFVSQLVEVATAPTPDETYNFAFNPEAIVVATRPFADVQSNNIEVATVSDPDLGLSMRAMLTYDMAERGHRLGLDVLYGVAKGREAAGILVRG